MRSVIARSVLSASFSLAVAGCTRGDLGKVAPEPVRSAVPAAAGSATPATASPVPEAPALEAQAFEPIEVGSGEIAWIAAPVGARDKRPVIVGVHGAGDRPDWACTAWREVVASHAFVVCPQSRVAHPKWAGTFVWGSAGAIAAQADRAVAAARARYGAWMADGPMVYGGWSQGGTLAAQVLAARRGAYDRVVLVEVGHTELDADAVAASFVAAGVQRAVVACESVKCRTFAQSFEGAARRRRLPVRVSDAGLRHHWFDEPVYRSLAPKMVWLVQDEQRFAGLGAAVDARWMTD